MSIFRFETSMPFPITRITTEVKHTEVKKPSGISYILLVLINDSNDKHKKISDLLIQFGVSKDLHAIFADEINILIHDLQIIECTYHYDKKYFSEYTTGNFGFTKKGKKIFKEELIPSKNTVEDKEKYWFDPGRKKLMIKIPDDWRIGKINFSELPNSFAENFPFTDNNQLEEFLNSQKGNGICVKKDEIITDVNIIEQAFFFKTFPIQFEININTNEIKFLLEETNLQTFFDKYYQSKIIENCLVVKRKFKFNSVSHQIKKIDEKWHIVGLHYPEAYEQFLNGHDHIVLTKGNYIPNLNSHVFKSPQSIEELSNFYETLHFTKNNAIALAPLEIPLNDKINNDIVTLPLLVEIELKQGDVEFVLNKLTKTMNTYKMDNIKDLHLIYSYLKDYQALTNAYEAYFSDDIEHNMNVLKSIKDLVNIHNIEAWFNEKAKELYNVYFNVIALDAINYQLTFSSWLIKYLAIPDEVIIKKAIITNADEDKIKVYDALENAGFKYNDILKDINLYPEIIMYILGVNTFNSESKLFLKMQTLKESFDKLKKISGLESLKDFIVKEDIDKKQYRETYKGFKHKLKEIDILHHQSNIVSKEFEEYVSNFDYLYSLFNEEEIASSNPKNITRKQIEKKVKGQDYFSTIIYLSVKLEWLLKEKLNVRGKLYDMIEKIDEDIITQKEKDLLHILRKERNNLVHPNGKKTKLNSEIIDQIIDVIFKKEMLA